MATRSPMAIAVSSFAMLREQVEPPPLAKRLRPDPTGDDTAVPVAKRARVHDEELSAEVYADMPYRLTAERAATVVQLAAAIARTHRAEIRDPLLASAPLPFDQIGVGGLDDVVPWDAPGVASLRLRDFDAKESRSIGIQHLQIYLGLVVAVANTHAIVDEHGDLRCSECNGGVDSVPALLTNARSLDPLVTVRCVHPSSSHPGYACARDMYDDGARLPAFGVRRDAHNHLTGRAICITCLHETVVLRDATFADDLESWYAFEALVLGHVVGNGEGLLSRLCGCHYEPVKRDQGGVGGNICLFEFSRVLPRTALAEAARCTSQLQQAVVAHAEAENTHQHHGSDPALYATLKRWCGGPEPSAAVPDRTETLMGRLEEMLTSAQLPPAVPATTPGAPSWAAWTSLMKETENADEYLYGMHELQEAFRAARNDRYSVLYTCATWSLAHETISASLPSLIDTYGDRVCVGLTASEMASVVGKHASKLVICEGCGMVGHTKNKCCPFVVDTFKPRHLSGSREGDERSAHIIDNIEQAFRRQVTSLKHVTQLMSFVITKFFLEMMSRYHADRVATTTYRARNIPHPSFLDQSIKGKATPSSAPSFLTCISPDSYNELLHTDLFENVAHLQQIKRCWEEHGFDASDIATYTARTQEHMDAIRANGAGGLPATLEPSSSPEREGVLPTSTSSIPPSQPAVFSPDIYSVYDCLSDGMFSLITCLQRHNCAIGMMNDALDKAMSS